MPDLPEATHFRLAQDTAWHVCVATDVPGELAAACGHVYPLERLQDECCLVNYPDADGNTIRVEDGLPTCEACVDA